jgi:hypothetical protein
VGDSFVALNTQGHASQIKQFLDFVYQDKYQLQFDEEYDLLPATTSAISAPSSNTTFAPSLQRLPTGTLDLVTALIFTFIAAWNEFIVALTLTTNNTTAPLTVALNGYIGEYQVDWQHLLGGSVVATLPVIILFAFIEGKVVGGLTASSVK